MPVGGGPPARSPHASLRLGVVDLEARPGPATAHRHRGQAPRFAARPCPPVPPAPSTPVVLGALACCLARPHRRQRAPQPGPASGDSPVPSGPSGALHTSGTWCAEVWLGASSRCPARPHRRQRAPQPGPASGDSPVPSGPSGALHTSGTWCAEVWLGASSRCPALTLNQQFRT